MSVSHFRVALVDRDKRLTLLNVIVIITLIFCLFVLIVDEVLLRRLVNHLVALLGEALHHVFVLLLHLSRRIFDLNR